jgi:hypothetical protein
MPKTELKNEQIKTLYGTLAVPLTALLEKGDQAEAGRLLTEDIFPLHLRNLQNHTRPMRLVQLSVEELEEQLLASPQSDRLDVLKKALADAQMSGAAALAQELAIAHYLAKHPGKVKLAGSFYTPAVQAWVQQGTGAIALAAHDHITELTALKKRMALHWPEMANGYRMEFSNTESILENARSGYFGAAQGGLVDFLIQVGEAPDTLNVH